MTGSVTNYFQSLREGDAEGARIIFERYFDKLVAHCQGFLAGKPPRMADGEDIAQQALASFFRAASEKRYPDLQDRHGLWKLLLTISGNKAKSLLKRENRQKRGGGKVIAENVLAGADPDEGWRLDLEMGDEPSPEMVASLLETLAGLDASLPDAGLRRLAELKLAGYLNAEISQELKCSLATVERRLRRIRDLLNPSSDRDPKAQP